MDGIIYGFQGSEHTAAHFFFSFSLFFFFFFYSFFWILISDASSLPLLIRRLFFQNVPLVNYHVTTKCASTKTSSAITTSIVTMGATNAIAVRVFKPFRTCSRWCFSNVPDLSGTLYLFFFFLRSILRLVEKCRIDNPSLKVSFTYIVLKKKKVKSKKFNYIVLVTSNLS